MFRSTLQSLPLRVASSFRNFIMQCMKRVAPVIDLVARVDRHFVWSNHSQCPPGLERSTRPLWALGSGGATFTNISIPSFRWSLTNRVFIAGSFWLTYSIPALTPVAAERWRARRIVAFRRSPSFWMKTSCVSSFLTTRTLQLSCSCAQKHEGCSLACWFEFGATLLRPFYGCYFF